MSNVIDSASLSETTNDTETQQLHDKIQNIQRKIAASLVANSLPNEEPSEINVGPLTFLASKLSVADSVGNEVTSGSTGAGVTVPDLGGLVPAKNESVVAKVVFKKYSNFPVKDVNQSGVVEVEFSQNNVKISVENISYFPVKVPRLPGDEGLVPVCKFWDKTIGNWSTRGVRAGTTTEDTYTCETSHLSSFSASLQKEISTVEININTFEASDIKAEAFSMTEPVLPKPNPFKLTTPKHLVD